MRTTSRFSRVAVSAGLVVAVGAGVLGITSFASAQISGPSSAPQVVEVSTSDDTPPPSQSSTSGFVEADRLRVSPLAVAATALGMNEAELRTELEAGKSIAQVAETKNVDLQVVVDALIAQHKAHIAEHVAEGKLTQAEADEKLANLEARVTEMVNKTGLPMKGGPGGKGGHGGKLGHIKAASEEVAAVLNLTTTELATQLREGKSLAAIAEAQDVDINKVKEVLTAEFKAHLDEEVAEGKHTQEEADAKLAKFESRLDDMVNTARPQGGKKGHGHGRSAF
jgi:lipoate-protein ligase A